MINELLIITGLIIGSVVNSENSDKIILPKPKTIGKTSVEEALNNRRTVRSFSNQEISIEELGQLLWAGQGITSDNGKRTAPSAGALYPLEIYVVAGNVKGLVPAVYKYNPKDHSIKKALTGDKRRGLADAALSQEQIITASVDIIITAVYERTSKKYGRRTERYVHIEVGHVAQNILLQAESLKLVSCPVGAYNDEKVKKYLEIEEEPLYILTIGR